MILEIINVSKNFGGIRALDSVSFSVDEQQIVGLIGPNGSGKTTLFNIISGLLKADSGEIVFNGSRIDSLSPEKRARMGIRRTFQGLRLIDELSTVENVLISSLPSVDFSYDQAYSRAIESLEVVGLQNKRDQKVSELSEVEKRCVEIARALAGEPKLILLDEIMAGLTEAEQDSIAELINSVRDDMRTTVIWVEHVLRAMFDLVNVDKIVVLNWGRKIAEDTPNRILRNKEVIEAYLGKLGELGGEASA